MCRSQEKGSLNSEGTVERRPSMKGQIGVRLAVRERGLRGRGPSDIMTVTYRYVPSHYLAVRERSLGVDDRAAEPRVDDVSLGRHCDDHGEGEAVDARDERAELWTSYSRHLRFQQQRGLLDGIYVRYCTILHCAVPYCTALHCTALHGTALYFTVLYCTILYCTILYYTVLSCTVPYRTLPYCTVLYCTVL